MYRAAWFALAATAAGILLLSMLHPAAGALIVGLRLLKAAIVMTVATILFRRRQHDAVAALLSLALLLWTITSSFDFASSMTGVPMILDRLRFLLFTIALLLFPNGEWRPRWGRGIAIASVIVFAIGTAEALNRLPTHSFLPLAIPCVIAAIATLIIRFRTASAEAERLQLKWVALGLASGVGCILAARAGFALMMRTDLSFAAPLVFEALFQCGIVLVALGILVSLLRYRLFDVEAAVTRSAAYGGLTKTSAKPISAWGSATFRPRWPPPSPRSCSIRSTIALATGPSSIFSATWCCSSRTFRRCSRTWPQPRPLRSWRLSFCRASTQRSMRRVQSS
jgi:hypothetical protein